MKLLKRDPGALNDEALRDISRQVMEGLLYLHDNNVVHNDMKPSNILITGDGTAKISDFGISGTGRVRLDSAGTPSFMAPEGRKSPSCAHPQHLFSFLTSFMHILFLCSCHRRSIRWAVGRLLCTRSDNVLSQVQKNAVCRQGWTQETTVGRPLRPNSTRSIVISRSSGSTAEGFNIKAHGKRFERSHSIGRRSRAPLAESLYRLTELNL